MNRLSAPLLAAALISILACADADAPADDDLAIQQTDVADVRAGEVAGGGATTGAGDATAAGDAAGFCEAWDELSRADDPPSPEQLQAVLDNAPESLRDATAMYVEVVRSHGSARGVVSAMDFDQEMQMFSIVEGYTRNCIGE